MRDHLGPPSAEALAAGDRRRRPPSVVLLVFGLTAAALAAKAASLIGGDSDTAEQAASVLFATVIVVSVGAPLLYLFRGMLAAVGIVHGFDRQTCRDCGLTITEPTEECPYCGLVNGDR